MENNVGVALTKELCPVCLKELSGDIVINTKLTQRHKKEVENLHNKIVGFSNKICDKCKEDIGDGIYIVGINESKSDDMNNPYRTGHIVGIKKEAFERIFTDVEEAIKKQMCYMTEEVMIEIGLI